MTFKFPTVRNFLCYFELTTGGLILGWIDTVLYGLVLIFLTLNIVLGMAIVDSEQLDNLTLLGLVIDTVVQVVLMILFLGISLAFLKGIKDRSPKYCLPFVVLVGLQAAASLLEGLVFLNIGWIIFAGIKIYLFMVVYSIYILFTYGDEQAAYEAHQNANSAGYEQYYEPEGYAASGYNNNSTEDMGYQTTEFKAA